MPKKQPSLFLAIKNIPDLSKQLMNLVGFSYKPFSASLQCILHLTVEEGLDKLKTLSAVDVQIRGRSSCLRIPEPDKLSGELLAAIDIRLPEVLPRAKVHAGTRKKLPASRK